MRPPRLNRAGVSRTRKSPARAGLFYCRMSFGLGLLARRLAQHVVVELLLLDAEPEMLLGEERLPRLVDGLELRVLRRLLVVEFLRRLVAGVEDLAREGPQLRAA